VGGAEQDDLRGTLNVSIKIIVGGVPATRGEAESEAGK
jgi:hypothetical protein